MAEKAPTSPKVGMDKVWCEAGEHYVDEEDMIPDFADCGDCATPKEVTEYRNVTNLLDMAEKTPTSPKVGTKELVCKANGINMWSYMADHEEGDYILFNGKGERVWSKWKRRLLGHGEPDSGSR